MVWNFKKIVKIGVEPNRRKRVNIDAYQTIKKNIKLVRKYVFKKVIKGTVV